MLSYRNGIFIPKDRLAIDADDLGFERGFAVFEYIRVRDGRIPFLKDHLQRLKNSQEVLHFDEPLTMEVIEDIIHELQQHNTLQNSYFKIIISGRLVHDVPTPILTIYQDVYKPYPESFYADGVSLIITEYTRPFPTSKTTFYLGSLRYLGRMRENHAQEILFYSGNTISECSRSNIFVVKNNLIYTPDSNMLPGVTRKHVLHCAKKEFIVIEKEISTKELFSADEVFITSTTKNIMPVVQIENTLIADGKPGYITGNLMQMFSSYCNNYMI
jgi:branched-subunit amino acid aminotransferase/4-amino-4-deoxychorismate lyase